MFKKITSYIQKRIPVSKDELEMVFSQVTSKNFQKGEYFLRTGEYCRHIGFLNSGIIMEAAIDNSGKEVITNFMVEGCFFTYVEGLTDNFPSHKNFVFLENSEALLLSKENMQKVFNSNPRFINLFSQILTEDLSARLLNEQNAKTLSLEERYHNLQKQFPDAFQRIPLKYLAGYLGIEPPSLSRLRRRLTGK